ncbi:MAG: N,N-dimethylformamidase beta subunit family domain-containing protein [Actinomycetota bacterium]
MPTYTWQAYNFYDYDGDGRGDTWYASWRSHTTRLGRPYLNRGVPPHFRGYDLPFLHWLGREGILVDVLTDSDVEHAGSGDRLAHAYNLVVFPGHHEYVTALEYSIVRRYRDLGGNLAWLSANNFFWKVVRRGSILERVAQWRALGQPEAALIGVQYRGNDEGARKGPFEVADDDAPPWFYRGTGLLRGASFGEYGVEIDARAPASPPQTRVLASIPHLFGTRFTAEMTFYATPAGAKVFAAGAFTLAGDAGRPVVGRLLGNLLAELGRP